MKNRTLVFLLVSILLYCSCDETVNESDKLPDGALPSDLRIEDENNDEAITSKDRVIVAWDKVSLLDKVSKPNKFVKTIFFGTELEVIKDTTLGTKKYWFVKDSVGFRGWVGAGNVMENAQVMVVTEAVTIFSKPDPMSLTKDKLLMGQVILVSSEKKGGMLAFCTPKMIRKGFIQDLQSISNVPFVIEAGKNYTKALDGDTDALNQLIENEKYAQTVFGRYFLSRKDSLLKDAAIEESIENQIIESENKRKGLFGILKK